MSTESHVKPIVARLEPTVSRAFDGPADKPGTFICCGGYHGSVGEHIACLEVNLRRARASARWAYGTLMGGD
jgi:hypothetical protein